MLLMATACSGTSGEPDASPAPSSHLEGGRVHDGSRSDSSGKPASDAAGHADASGKSRDASLKEAAVIDAAVGASDAGDGESNACAVSGAPGTCMMVTACASLADHTSFSGYCPGPADIECCIVTPNTDSNPPVPAGYVLMQQSQVTSAMTAWAVMILDDPSAYPMFSTTTMVFGTLTVLARVEWHPPDFQNSAVHRGVTLYEPAG
jgi:hypothetical protein